MCTQQKGVITKKLGFMSTLNNGLILVNNIKTLITKKLGYVNIK